MTNISRSPGLALCLACWAGSLARAVDTDAELVIRQATEEIYEALDQQCAILEQQPEHLYTLVDSILMPHADMERMSRWVLGRYWRDANDDQRSEFIEQFGHSPALLSRHDRVGAIRGLVHSADAGSRHAVTA